MLSHLLYGLTAPASCAWPVDDLQELLLFGGRHEVRVVHQALRHLFGPRPAPAEGRHRPGPRCRATPAAEHRRQTARTPPHGLELKGAL